MAHSRNLALLVFFLTFLAGASADTKTYQFNIGKKQYTRLCKSKPIIVVNDMFPGPQIDVTEGDRLLITVKNNVDHNVTLHWHGLFQNRTGWFDGPAYITQCPIPPGGSYLYNFTISGQRGTLWWHAHITWLRATVYGALIIQPKQLQGMPKYPFLQNGEEDPIEEVFLLGEWWNSDVLDVVNQAFATGTGNNNSDAFTINGLPGPLYEECSKNDTYVVTAKPNKKYLLRVINAAMNVDFFFAVANHTMTVVEVDASYTKRFTTSAIVVSPGQTVTVLITTDQPNGSYYIAARAYNSAPMFIPFANTTTAAIFSYEGSTSQQQTPVLPSLPAFNDSDHVARFDGSLRSEKNVRKEFPVPQSVDKHMFITVGLNIQDCPPGAPKSSCQGGAPPNTGRIRASMNNISYVAPDIAFLQQHYNQARFNTPVTFGVDFPSTAARTFDFTSNPPLANQNAKLATKATELAFGTSVQVVLQGTTIVFPESHPIHLHGHDFYVVASGTGNYNASNVQLNLKDPPARNTISVPAGGWAVVRFVADNPGAWIFHCHLDMHSALGLDSVFIVKNGQGPLQTLDAPPSDLPKC